MTGGENDLLEYINTATVIYYYIGMYFNILNIFFPINQKTLFMSPIFYCFCSMLCVRGEHSLIRSLESRGVSDWRRYVCFTSLRTHDVLDGALVTELVYIHSKLLIVDDCLVIAGSANINDRSMLGERDSEVALIMEVSRASTESSCCYYFLVICRAGKLTG